VLPLCHSSTVFALEFFDVQSLRFLRNHVPKQKMDLPSKKVFDALRAKRVDTLHHANIVLTATQFLRHGALFSSGTVERRKPFQPPSAMRKSPLSKSLPTGFCASYVK
jgi:hypothetical protein